MKLTLGTVQFGLNYGINNSRGKPSLENAFAILARAYQLGIDELDTADAYGNSTEVISAYLARYPEQKFKIMSKFIGEGEITYQEAFESSCKKLGLNFLDGYYFHRFQDFKTFSDFDYIHKLKSNGRLSKFAVSLYSLEELEIAIHSKEVDLIQLPFNIFDRSEEKINLLKTAKEKNKLIYIRSAFLQGLFFKDVNNLPTKLAPLREALVKLHHLVDIYNVSMENLCLRFAVDQDYVEKVIVGVDSVAQLENNVRSLEGDLPEELVKEVLKIKIDYPALLNPASWNN
jgi:aryl-alcohol dehydrogenase-like predicted oxidoreductase